MPQCIPKPIDKSKRVQTDNELRILAEALADTAFILNSTLDQDEVFDHILDNFSKGVPNKTANIMIVDDMQAKIIRSKGYDDFGTAEVLKNGVMRGYYA